MGTSKSLYIGLLIEEDESEFSVLGLGKESGACCGSKMSCGLLLKTCGDPLNLIMDGIDGCSMEESLNSC